VHEAAVAQDASGDVPLRMDDRFGSEKALLESSGTQTIVRRSNSATRRTSEPKRLLTLLGSFLNTWTLQGIHQKAHDYRYNKAMHPTRVAVALFESRSLR